MTEQQVIEPIDPVVDPNALAQIEPVVTNESDPPPQSAPELPKRAMIPLTAMQERLAQEAAKLERAERRAADAEALADRLRAGNDQTPRQEPQQRTQEPDRQADVRREAAAMRLAEDSMEVRNRGIAEYGASFVESLGILQAVGAVTDDFVADVLAVDKSNAHKIFDQIAKDPERAATLAAMSSRQRIAELTRMSVAQTAPKVMPAPVAPAAPPRSVSQAPAPAPRIDPAASQIVDWRSDKATDAEFTAGFNDMLSKRSARR